MTSVDERPETAPAPAPRRRWSRRTTVVVSVVTVLVLVLATIGGYALWAKWRIDQALAEVHSVQVFASIDPATRPPESPDGGMTFLLAGTDVLSPVATTGTEAGQVSDGTASGPPTVAPNGPGRSDVIMLVHVNGDHSQASVVSLPRDSLVDIPAYVDAAGVSHPAVRRKINAAFSLGGPTLLVRTVEQLTGLRIDHFAYIDYDGLIRLVDAVGGVTVNNLNATSNVYGNPEWNFPAGAITLDGFHARVWVSQRKNLPRSDLDRARNSRELIRAISAKLASPEVLGNPARLDQVIGFAGQVATVDETLDPGTMKSLALQMRGLDLSSIPMRTAPTTGKSTYNGEVVFNLDETQSKCLWQAIGSSDLRSVTTCSQD
jgi:LCP family protein required for cell wall assembly